MQLTGVSKAVSAFIELSIGGNSQNVNFVGEICGRNFVGEIHKMYIKQNAIQAIKKKIKESK